MKTIVSSDTGFINFVAHNAQNIGETENQPKIKLAPDSPTANTEFLSGRNMIMLFEKYFMHLPLLSLVLGMFVSSS